MNERKQKPNWRPVESGSAEFRELEQRDELSNVGYAEEALIGLHTHGEIAKIRSSVADTLAQSLEGEVNPDVRDLLEEHLRSTQDEAKHHREAKERILEETRDHLASVLSEDEAYAYSPTQILRRRIEQLYDEAGPGVFGDEIDSAAALIEAVQQKTLDNESHIKLLEAEAARFERVRREVLADALTWLSEVFDKAIEIDSKKYVRCSRSDMVKRLNQMQFACRDRIRARDLDIAGHATGTLVSVDIDLFEASRRDARHVTIHEIAHHISGPGYAVHHSEDERSAANNRILRGLKPGHGIPESTPLASTRKLGLHFRQDQRPHKVWMNEALTELLAAFFSGERVTMYHNYVDEIWRMVDAGVEWETLFDAYWETMLVEPEEGTRIPKYDALIRRIREVEGPGALQRHRESILEKEQRVGRGWRKEQELRTDRLPE